MLPLAAMLSFACAKREPDAPLAPVVVPVASTRSPTDLIATREPPAPDAGLAPTPTPTPLEPRCAGSAIDLAEILLDGHCRSATEDFAAMPAGALRMTIAAPHRLAPGAEGIVTVTLTNTTAADLDVRVTDWLPSGPGLDLLGLPLTPPNSQAGQAGNPTPLRRAVSTSQSTMSADGKRSFDARWALLGVLAESRLRVRIAPGGFAEMRVVLHARGFLPGRRYDTSVASPDWPPDPLPPGRYKVTLRLGIGAVGDAVGDAVVDLEVRR